MLRRIRRRLHALADREGVEREMDEEMRFHIEMEIEDRVRAGATPEEARRAALRDFGGVERFKDEVRDARGLRPWEDLVRDLRLALRTLRRSAAFSVVTVLILGVGIGAATAIFSVVNGVLLRPLPYPGSERIVQLWQVNDGGEQSQMSDPNFNDLRERSRSFAGLAEFTPGAPVSVLVGDEPLRVIASSVSRDFLPVLGVQPAVGRAFLPEEQREGGSPAVLVSDGFWRRHLGGSPDLSGRTLAFDNRVHAVVGVMPPGFAFPAEVDLWTPRELYPAEPYRTGHNWRVVGRLRDGVTLEQARLEGRTIAARLKAEHGDDTWMTDVDLVPLREQIVGQVRPVLLVLLVAAAFLLVVALANAGNLLLARAGSRRRELAVRLALGASRWHLARQFLAETLVLAAGGAALGVVLASVGTRMLVALGPGAIPRMNEIRVDWTVWAFALALAASVALALALSTTLQSTRGSLRKALAEGQRTQAGGSSPRLRSTLIVVQVALTLVLLVGASLLGRSLLRLLSADPGYRTEDLVVLDLDLPWPEDEAAGRRQSGFYEDLMARLRSIPGVLEVGGVNAFPLGDARTASGTFLVLDPGQEVSGSEENIEETIAELGELMKDETRTGYAAYRVASEGYFGSMGIPLIRGRLFDERDQPEAPHVALVSASLAKSRWPDEDPIGKRIEFGNMDGDLRPFTVVGVVGDVREASLAAEPQPTVYGYYRQRTGPASQFDIVMHTTGSSLPVVAAARRILREAGPEIPPRFRTVEGALAESLARRRFSMMLLGAFGGASLLLAVMGIYGVIAYLVAQRTREIGIRMAFGARIADVLALIVRQGVVLAGLGVALGAAVALALTRTLSTLLYGVSATDPLTFAAVALLLLGMASIASYIPARRAARVSPMVAMRPD